VEAVDWSVPLAALWAVGVLACLGWYAWSYLRFSKNIRKNSLSPSSQALEVLWELDPAGRVALAECPQVSTPMLLGVVRPVVVLPVGLEGRERLEDILAHELTHARRHDLLYKWFAVGVTSLHWFNPLMILVRRQISRACELACDEAVVRGLDDGRRQHYGQTLLDLAAAPPSGLGLLAVTLCEEKEQLKERLVSIVHYRKKGAAAVLLTLLLVLAVGGCALVNAAETISSSAGNSSQGGSVPDKSPQSTAPDNSADPTMADVPEDFQAILLGREGFLHISADGQEYRDINSLPAVFSPYSSYAKVSSWAMADLDGDGQEELILQLTDVSGDMGGFEIIRFGENSQMLGCSAHYKMISDLKTDGTFHWSSLTGYAWGTARLTFTETGFELQNITSGSTREGGEPYTYEVDGQSATEEEYRAAEDLQNQKPDAVWRDPPEAHKQVLTYWNADLDGDGMPDKVTAFSDWDRTADDIGMTTLRITMATGAVLEKQWEEGASLGLLPARLTAPDRDAIILLRSDRTSNYDATEYYVLEVVGGELVESLTLDYAQQEELGLILTGGCSTKRLEGSALNCLRVTSLVDKWAGEEWYTFRYTPEGWVHEADGILRKGMWITGPGGRELMVIASGAMEELDSRSLYYDEIQVSIGDSLIQTITPKDVIPDENVLFEGFLAGYGFLDYRDVNFDGVDDLGLMCGSTYNGPMCWFIWDDASRQFCFAFYSSISLNVDQEKQQLIDEWKDGLLGSNYYIYEYDDQGQRVLVDRYFVPYP